MMIGDQLITDVAAGNRAKLRCIYVDKLVKEDQPTTRFNRIFEKPKRKKLFKKHLLREWEEI
jgi:predicted HAD superfamily phosphohydrolase YqeG